MRRSVPAACAGARRGRSRRLKRGWRRAPRQVRSAPSRGCFLEGSIDIADNAASLAGGIGDPSTWLQLAFEPASWAALATLSAMEVVLGVDNLVFIALLSNRIVESKRAFARTLGLTLALLFRLLLLASASWVAHLRDPVLILVQHGPFPGHAFSARDLLLLAGGLFLVWKATREISERVDPHAHEEEEKQDRRPLGLWSALSQIIVIDIVFSVDSIITAVGMTDQFPIMAIAVIVAIAIMMLASGPLGRFIERNPSVLMLALSFLLMIGMTLIADGFGFHIERGYIYAAMLFSALVELLNGLARRVKRPVE